MGRGPLNLPPVGFENMRGEGGNPAHPLGTDNSGRDMVALIIAGAPNSLMVGFIAAGFGMLVGIILGFTSGFMGGFVDDVIRLSADITITIPSLLVLIVIQSVVPVQSSAGDGGAAVVLRLAATDAPDSGAGDEHAREWLREDGAVERRANQRHHVPRDDAEPAALSGGQLHRQHDRLDSGGGRPRDSGPGAAAAADVGRTIQNAIDNSAILRDMWWWWGLR